MSIAGLVEKLMSALLNVIMENKEHRPPLTDEERAEKRRLRAIYKKYKAEWIDKGEKLTDVRLGEIVGEAADRESPYTQGFVWQVTSEKSSTRIPEDFAIGMAKAFGFDVGEIGSRFADKLKSYGISEASHIKPVASNLKKIDNVIIINQYENVRGAMGKSAYLLETQGEVINWRVTPQWVKSNLPAHTGAQNLRIITGLGNSMQGMFNSGDPLIVDSGIKSVDYDAVYFFRVGDEGFVKLLQRVPGEGIRVISKNQDYPVWNIRKDMDFEVFGRVLKVWEGKDL